MEQTDQNPLEDAFKQFDETNSFEDLQRLVDELRQVGRASHAIDIMRDWLKSADIHSQVDNICCLAQRLAFLGAPDDSAALFEKTIHPGLPHYQTWLTEMAWTYFIKDDYAKGRALWQRALSQELIEDYLRFCAPSDWLNVAKERYIDEHTDLRGKSVRILWDGGLGDAIQNLRYIDDLWRDGVTKVYMDMLDPFVSLVANTRFDLPNTFLEPLTDTDCDYFALYQSLCLRYEDGQGKRDIFPYLNPEHPGERLKPVLDEINQRHGKPKVAIFWRSTNTQSRSEPYRSMAIRDVLPILKLPHIDFFSCINGELSQEELFYLQHYHVQHLGDQIDDLHDLACTLKAMDLVISVDSAPIHLAGAMAVPVYGLLSAISEWRWGRSRNTSFLYPTLALFRQKRLNDWRDPVNAVVAELSKRSA